MIVGIVAGANFDDVHSHPIPGATLGLGASASFESARSSIEIGVNVPQWHVSQSFRRYETGGRHYENTLTVRHRSIDVLAQYSRKLLVRRAVNVACFVGGGFAYRPYKSVSMTNEILADGTAIAAPPSNTQSTRNYVAATGGLDLAVRVSAHISVRPRLRVLAFPNLLDDSGAAPKLVTVRPELGIGWAF